MADSFVTSRLGSSQRSRQLLLSGFYSMLSARFGSSLRQMLSSNKVTNKRTLGVITEEEWLAKQPPNLCRIKKRALEWSVFLLKKIKISQYSCLLMVKPLGSKRKFCPIGPNSATRSTKVRKVLLRMPYKSFAQSSRRKLKEQSLNQLQQITKQSSIGSLVVCRLTTQTQRDPCQICECDLTKLWNFSKSALSKWSSGKIR